MILIKCCATCANYDDGTCTVDCHSTTADDWCPRWEEEDGTVRTSIQGKQERNC